MMAEREPLSVCLTFDFDGLAGEISYGATNYTNFSNGEFHAFAMPRILDLLERNEVKGTFFTPGHTALAHPEIVRRIVADGHEIGHHGWVHEHPASLTPRREREAFRRGIEALQEVCGVRPKGYRAPDGAFSDATIDVMLENEIEYDSSCSATDYFPYYLRQGDVWSETEPYVFGERVDLVEVPFAPALNDFPYLAFAPNLGAVNQFPNSMVREVWLTEFDFGLRECPGGVYVLTMHPAVTGRGRSLVLLQEVLDHIRGSGAVRFETMGEVAARWRAANPLSADAR
jgi:peptidoglycan/xylan/chitin deacetylase (PgdA/CDA1 family)